MQPVLLLSHGASVFTSDPANSLHLHLHDLGGNLLAQRPRAVLMVSAHFIQPRWTLTSSPRPETIHDHPVAQLRSWRYPVPGAPALAKQIADMLQASGFDAGIDGQRGLDHGAWLVAAPLLPADLQIPVLQLSLHADLDPDTHLQVGRSLRSLRAEGILVITSGGMTHNQDEFREGFFSGGNRVGASAANHSFDAWLNERLAQKTGTARSEAIAGFMVHPDAAWAHPSPDHLMPLFVGLGAAEDSVGTRLWGGFQFGLSTAGYWLD